MYTNNKNRYPLPDLIRGIAVINMVIYHTLWDIVYIFGVNIEWYKGIYAFIWQQAICYSFIALSGFCMHLGKKTLKRGFTVFLCGAAVSLVTAVFTPKSPIVFGILTFIGSAMLITGAADKYISKLPPAVGFFISIILFALTYNISDGKLGFGSFDIMLPDFLYKNIFTAYFGFMYKGFYSSDYFPLFPWLFMFLIGYFSFELTGGKVMLAKTKGMYIAPVNFIGRHALLIYMLHQPPVYGALKILFSVIL